METQTYDLVIIGGGPGGYVAAIRAAQLGMKVACVEARERLGGTCVNVGCIPSKALLTSSHLYTEAQTHLAEHGVGVATVTLDLAAMQARKDKVVDQNTRGVAFLFKKHNIAHVRGTGVLTGRTSVAVTPADGGAAQTLTANNIIIATGSIPMPLAGVPVDEVRIVSSTGGLALAAVPKRLIVIGAGYIGLELGSVWARLGSQVTVVEYLPRILPGMDDEVATTLQRLLGRQKLTLRLGTKVTGASVRGEAVALSVQPAEGGDAEVLEAEVVLVAVGRKANTGGVGLEAVGVKTDARGMIAVDAHFATSVPGIYAIGDCIPGPMLAHKAEEDGVACVENIAGLHAHVDYNQVPGVVYTWPEAAAVGQTEQQLKAAGVEYAVGKFPFLANGRARANGFTDGFVKILAEKGSGTILGAHILGPEAGTLIHEVVVAMGYGGTAEHVARTCHAHPTLAEAVKEAALGAIGRAIHI